MTTARAEDALRRTVDITAAGAALVVLSPVLAVIAVAVKMDSPGPVIFRQQRVGRYGRPFTIYKFRTMRVDQRGPSVTSADDDRITRLGRRLRATKLDELPQLVNVVKGDMSLVGPRPEVPEFASRWPADYRHLILSVRPGITDPITCDLRDEESLLASADEPAQYYEKVLLPQKARAYADYVARRTLRLDAATVARTLVALTGTSR